MSERLAVFNATEGGFGLPTGLPAVAEETTSIYALNCPVSGRLRYVGKSDNPKDRLRRHIRDSRKDRHHCACWIKSLVKKGVEPVSVVLDTVPDKEWKFWEKEYIRLFRAIFPSLVNLTEGGEGVCGYERTAEDRAKQSAGQTGRKDTDETRLKKSIANIGKKKTSEHITNMRVALTGRKLSSEHRRAISAGLRGPGNPNFGKPLHENTRAASRDKRVGARSKFFGVSWNTEHKKWKVQLCTPKGRVYIGSFADEIEAARVYDAEAKLHGTPFTKLNFPNE